VEPEKSPADLKIDDISLYITTLEKQFETVLKHSENLVKRSGESGSALFDFSQGLTSLGQTEGEDLGRVLTQVLSIKIYVYSS
jgi:hypothetical protein